MQEYQPSTTQPWAGSTQLGALRHARGMSVGLSMWRLAERKQGEAECIELVWTVSELGRAASAGGVEEIHDPHESRKGVRA